MENTLMMMNTILFTMLFSLFYKMMKKKMNNKMFNNPIECGYKNMEKSRSAMSTQMYIHMILFIMLEMEMCIIIMESKNNFMEINFNMMLFMIFILTMTTMEWIKSLMEWFN